MMMIGINREEKELRNAGFDDDDWNEGRGEMNQPGNSIACMG